MGAARLEARKVETRISGGIEDWKTISSRCFISKKNLFRKNCNPVHPNMEGRGGAVTTTELSRKHRVLPVQFSHDRVRELLPQALTPPTDPRD